MAVDYPIPQWLNPPNWGALALARNNAKQQFQLGRQKLAQDAQQFQSRMEMQRMAMEAEERVKAQQMKQQSEIAQHRLAVEAAYNNVRMSMQSQQIAQKEREVDLKYNEAAQKFAARQKFDDTVMGRIQAGTPSVEAFRNTLMEQGAGAQMPGSAYTSARNSEQAGFQPGVTERDGVRFAQVGPKSYQIVPPKSDGKSGMSRAAHGMLRITTPGKPDRFIKAPDFKFSKAKAVEEIMSEFGSFIDENSDMSGLNRQTQAKVIAARARLKQLMAMEEEERKQFEDESDDTEATTPDVGGFDFDYDPQSSSLLTNRPPETTE